MKSTLTLILAFIGCAITMANDITPKQAMQQALSFIEAHKGGSDGWNKVTDATQLTEAGQVEGLYIFNVEGNGGFVIVANDDAVTPILGYGEKGNVDVSNMPDNMRAWLKGYADEIAWVRTTLTGTETGTKEKSHSLDMDLEGRIPTAVKQPISPLLTCVWNQYAPYNGYCPLYDGTNQAVTGCVATAMAQAMYFTENRVGSTTTTTTAQIPSYSSYSTTMEAIPAGTELNWANMIDDYRGSYTSNQATAVALLMLCCGESVKMQYGSASSSNTSEVAPALRNYFGYSTTTQYVSRSYYSYANWIEIMYHELAAGRVVVYGAQSAGGGHDFIIDGYQGEDYFHINWGWGGMSDNYFKLSVLNPDEQGAGGSSSTDGYHYGQEAIIGIQKTSETGTVSELVTSAKVTPNLSVSSVTLDKQTITLGETVKVTVRVTNNGTSTYNGDISVGNTSIVAAGKTFTINAGETKDCVIDYTPSGFTGTVNIIAYKPNGLGAYSQFYGYTQPTLTVNPSSATNNVELTMTFDVANASATGGSVSFGSSGTAPVYNLLGNDFEVTFTLQNATSSDYSGPVLWCLIPNGESATINELYVSVPANTTKQVKAKLSDLDYSKSYIFEATYVKNNTYNLTPLVYYNLQRALTTYGADGTKTMVAPSGTSYSAPADALVVDVTGTSITQITPNANKNTLYISDGALGGLDGKNVVTNNLDGTYSATSIALEDDSPFYSPVDISVTKAEFTYQFTTAADGTNGWNTLMLPFDVTSVTADDSEIDWFHSSTDTGKNFWLKAFTNDTSDEVLFSFVSSSIEANTPYIVAFPGSKWGSKWDMSNKEIKFIGENTQLKKTSRSVVTGSYYRFVGSTLQDNTESIYSLNSEGNAFELKATGGSSPFRAYFKPDVFDLSVTSLGIGSDDATGINNVNGNGLREAPEHQLERKNDNPNLNAPVKVIKNGKLYIGNYNVAGQVVK